MGNYELNSAVAVAEPEQKQKRDGDDIEGARRPRRGPMKRLNLNLPETLYRDIENLASAEGRTMADVLRIGLGLAYLAASERKKGGQFAIIDAEGQLHRVILPY